MLHNNDVTIKLGKNRKITIHENHEAEDWEITLVDTGENTLKGARIHKIMDYIDDDFMVTYGDGVSNIDIRSLVDYHKKHGRIATVTGVSPPSAFGQIHVKNSEVVEFHEKPQIKEGIINGGFFVFSRKIFNYLNGDETCDLEMGALEQLTGEQQLMVFRHEGGWACMDTYRDTIYLNQLWENGQAFWKVWH
jgi:glucose-1-phosphate cytidylyltransferase